MYISIISEQRVYALRQIILRDENESRRGTVLLKDNKNLLHRKTTYTRTLALLFVLLLLLLFIWSIQEDYRLKQINDTFPLLFNMGIIHYTIQLKSFIPESQTVKGTLSVEPGLMPPWEILTKQTEVFYGPLFYQDLGIHYLAGLVSLKLKGLLDKQYLYKEPFQKENPLPIEITLTAFGNPMKYPFDKYIIRCALKCPSYIVERGVKKYVESLDNGESLRIINSMNGLFIRVPTKGELDQIKASVHATNPFSPVGYEHEYKEMNYNFKDMFILIIERPYYLRVMSIVLGLIVFVFACYIGFVLPLKDITISIVGFIVTVWAIRSILLSDTKIFPSYIDYIWFFMIVLLFGGIIFRVLWKGKVAD